jgi:hypothetical protein
MKPLIGEDNCGDWYSNTTITKMQFHLKNQVGIFFNPDKNMYMCMCMSMCMYMYMESKG